MLKILLIGIYDTNTVSLAPYVLKAYAHQYPHLQDVQIITKEFSLFTDTPRSISKQINSEHPDIVGFSCYIWNIDIVLRVINKLRDVTIILGGPQVTNYEKELLQDNPKIDVIATGEGEVTFKELLEHFLSKRKIETIRGLTTKSMTTPPREVVRDLNSIPSVYSDITTQNPQLTWITYETSRGCPIGCRYCTWSYSRIMRYFEINRVKKDLMLIFSHPNIKEIYLSDSSLLVNLKRAKQILRFIVKNNTGKALRFEFNPMQITKDIVLLLKQLPNNEFNLGLQTTNPQALTNIGRGLSLSKFKQNYELIKNTIKNSKITIDLIYGLPGDTIEGYKQSLEFAMSLPDVERILTNQLIVLPGSEFYKLRDLHKITIRKRNSFLIKKNSTFTNHDMILAKRYSFYVNVLYYNNILKKTVFNYATILKRSTIDVLIDFMDSLPFDLTNGLGFPYTIPTTKKDFQHRNAVLNYVIKRYHKLITAFDTYSQYRYSTTLKKYANNYSNYYYKINKIIS